MKAVILMLAAITMSTPEGNTLVIKPDQVVTVRSPTDGSHGCWFVLRNGKAYAVIEPCEVVRSLLESEPD